MGKVTLLGSAPAVPEVDRGNTHLAVEAGTHTILVDCTGNPIERLGRAGIQPNDLTDLILTHFHPDHVASAPLLLMDLWLMGRKASLHVHGLAHTLDRLEIVMRAYDWESWPGFYPLILHRLPEEEGALVLETPDLRVLSSPVKHLIPTIGLRFEFLRSGKSLAYSCDSEPCAQVIRLADGADTLIHEATGGYGHTSAAQAGEIAAQARAKRLVLVHYAGGPQAKSLTAQASAAFHGEIILGQDFMALDLS
jgi:ribonuclease Z